MLKRLRDADLQDRSLDIRGAKVYGADGEKIGTVDDVIVDTNASGNPYAIVDTGGWLKSRRFLVPSEYMQSRAEHPDDFHVSLTREQIETLPVFNEDVLKSDDRFAEYQSSYRSKWNTFGFDRTTTREPRVERVETRNFDTRQIEPTPVATTSESSTVMTGAPVSVYAVYHDQSKLETAVDRLKAAGFESQDISVVFPDRGRTDQFAMERNTKAPEGAATGGGTGIVVGGVLGWLAGIGTLAIPGIGPLLAAGPIVAALAGAGAGGVVGGIAGGLIGLGMPEMEAKRYEKEIKEGRMMLSVRCADPRFTGTARSILSETDARDVFETGERKAA